MGEKHLYYGAIYWTKLPLCSLIWNPLFHHDTPEAKLTFLALILTFTVDILYLVSGSGWQPPSIQKLIYIKIHVARRKTRSIKLFTYVSSNGITPCINPSSLLNKLKAIHWKSWLFAAFFFLNLSILSQRSNQKQLLNDRKMTELLKNHWIILLTLW